MWHFWPEGPLHAQDGDTDEIPCDLGINQVLEVSRKLHSARSYNKR
jgi:hypothetical protein